MVDDGGDEDPAELTSHSDFAELDLRLLRRTDFRPERRGAQVCRNIGIAEARGEAVLLLDSDDLLAPHCLEHRVAALTADSALDFCVGQCVNFSDQPDPKGPRWCEWRDEQDDLAMFLQGRVPWQTSGPLWRTSSLIDVGPWNEELEQAGHDYEFHIRSLALGLRHRRLPRVDYFWRAPRPDSFSSFDASRRQHRSGAHIAEFSSALESLDRQGVWTPERRSAARGEAARLATECRIHGGSFQTARSAVRAALQSRCIGPMQALEVEAALSAWFRIGQHIPALSYLSRREIVDFRARRLP